MCRMFSLVVPHLCYVRLLSLCHVSSDLDLSNPITAAVWLAYPRGGGQRLRGPHLQCHHLDPRQPNTSTTPPHDTQTPTHSSHTVRLVCPAPHAFISPALSPLPHCQVETIKRSPVLVHCLGVEQLTEDCVKLANSLWCKGIPAQLYYTMVRGGVRPPPPVLLHAADELALLPTAVSGHAEQAPKLLPSKRDPSFGGTGRLAVQGKEPAQGG